MARSAHPDLTIVIPTRNEVGNVGPLLHRIAPVADRLRAEVVFVDDSTDFTPEIIVRTAKSLDFPVRVFHREPAAQAGGLGGAVVLGMQCAVASRVAVMDADLQHPPELLVEMVEEMAHSGADLVVATRYGPLGSADGLGPGRTLVSKAATRLAQLLMPRMLGGVSDPMSGFFLLDANAVRLQQLRPNGFKILVEILGRTPGLQVAEVPFHFDARHSGSSKGSGREFLRFLHLLLTLRREARFLQGTLASAPERPSFAGEMVISSAQDAR